MSARLQMRNMEWKKKNMGGVDKESVSKKKAPIYREKTTGPWANQPTNQQRNTTHHLPHI